MNTKKLICAILAVLMLCSMTACRSGGTETTAPAVSGHAPNETTPAVSLPENETVGNLPDSTEPVDETTTPVEETTEPVEDPDEDPYEDPDEDPYEDPVEDPTEPEEDPTEPTQKPTQPKEDDPPATQPTEPEAGDDEPVVLTYEEYMALSPAEQQAYYESFPTLEDYIAWYNAAYAEYEENQDAVIATGPIDIGDYINP